MLQVQRPHSVPSKADYPPPPAHSSRGPSNKMNEKMSMHQTMPKTAELNAYGYSAYQPTSFFSHEPKNKSDHHKSVSQTGSLVVTKSVASVIDRDIQTLHGEHKNSVIVKHEKNPHHLEPRLQTAHSKSPQLRPDLMGHYLTTTQTHKTNLYDYRSPSQSPHHLTHAPSPHHHHHEAQNLGKAQHHRTSSNQLPSPHHPHAQQHSSPEVRYRNNSESSQATIYSSVSTKATIPVNYGYLPQVTSVQQHALASGSVGLSNSKPKVSSPAPHHIYGKPSAGIGSGPPMMRPAENPPSIVNPLPLTSKPPTLSTSVSPSPYHQQVTQYHPPHPHNLPVTTAIPPPAHSSRTNDNRTMYDRIYPGSSVPGGLSVKQSMQHGTSPPTAASAPSPISRNIPLYNISQNISGAIHSVQTQPLDFCVTSKYDSATSPKRKSTTPINSVAVSIGNLSGGPICLETKKRRIEPAVSPAQQTVYSALSQPQLIRVSEPSPLIANATTTMTTAINALPFRSTPNSLLSSQSQQVFVESLPDISVTAVTIPIERPPSISESIPSSSPIQTVVNTNTTQVPVSTTLTTTVSVPQSESPNTPVKIITTAPSNPDSEKSNSPGPTKTASSGSYPVRHLKKAWLQRHTGEDMEDTTGVMGTGSCVTLPINIGANINNPRTATPPNNSKDSPPPPPLTNSLHNIGSMAVNSINKTKHFGPKGSNNNRKISHKESSLNGHPNDIPKGDDSSSSDQERNRKDMPKRKPPKVSDVF